MLVLTDLGFCGVSQKIETDFSLHVDDNQQPNMTTMTTKITNSTKLALDKFYTKPHVVDACVNDLIEHVSVLNDIVIEPSAGNGAWLPYFDNILAYDLAPEADNIVQQDFLKLDLDQFNKSIHFVGNPPFGTNSCLAKQFIKKMAACANTQTIALILPSSFSKLRNQRAFPLCVPDLGT